MSAVRHLVLLASASSLLGACTSETSERKQPAAEGPEDSGPPNGASLGQPFTVSITVPDVPAGGEGTQCLKVRLGNPEPVKIGRVHNKLSAASHHLVVSAVEDPNEAEAPLFECAPFRAALIGAPLTVTQKHDDVIQLPEGVGFGFQANQLMHLEMHYLNTGDTTEDVVATAELFPLTSPNDVQEASFVIVGDLDIQIPPRSTHKTPSRFLAPPAAFDGVNFYAVTGHTHRFGTEVKLGTAASESDPGTTIYEPEGFDWAEAAVEYFSPPFQLPPGGGFRFECSWNNPTDRVVTYGESALTEMCFFWAYYYPKREGRRVMITGFENSPYARPKPPDAGQPDAAPADAGRD
jgi:hypothetical protein